MFLFLLLLPALWVGLIPLFFATPLYTVQELLCLCKVTFLASPISVRQPQYLPPPKQPLLSPPIWHTLSLASCVETGTVTCWSSFHFHTSNSAWIHYPWKQIIRLSYAWVHQWIRLHVESSWITSVLLVPKLHLLRLEINHFAPFESFFFGNPSP